MRTLIWFAYFWGYLIFSWPILHKGLKALRRGDEATVQAIVNRHVPQWAGRLLKLAGVEVTVTGRENIPQGRPCVFVANHRSYYDIPLMLTQLDAPHALVSKAEVGRIPLVRRWMELLHCVFVDREDARQSLRCLAEATERVKSGHSVVIFPEGTRYKGPEGGMGEFKGGAFRIATRAGAPLVPVAVCGSRAILEGDGHFTMKPGKVTIRILPPVETAGLSREELKALPARLEELVRRHVEEMAAEAAGQSAS